MESDYDRKFEEMKAYIPFLERMITRLDTGNSPTNPRQAQLNKIRSLRDLLQNKKKRMKMENLLKCEQVLVTLHAKVEQRDAVTEKRCDSSNLNVIKNNLNTVVSRLGPEVDHNDGASPSLHGISNQKEISPNKDFVSDDKNISPQSSRRNYTRVLQSPQKSSLHWQDISRKNVPLSSRSSLSYKKEKKKSKKSKEAKLKDLNITLNVPEEKLNSLNTEDILPRIINCCDSDVDITTLRELRSQILGELKQTGVKDDISELLLKSCKTNSKNKVPISTEIEEGELSDSESEAIESIYGNLVITNKDTSTSSLTNVEIDKPQKIQICLVINSDKNDEDTSKQETTENKNASIVDTSDFQSFSQSTPNLKEVNLLEINEKQNNSTLDNSSKTVNCVLKNKEDEQIKKNTQICEEKIQNSQFSESNQILLKCNLTTDSATELNTFPKKGTQSAGEEIIKYTKDKVCVQDTLNKNDTSLVTQPGEPFDAKSFIPNFYKSNQIDGAGNPQSFTKSNTSSEIIDVKTNNASKGDKEINLEKLKSSVEIPLLDLESTSKQDIVSEIDILQALKKEILGETTTTPIVDTNTPALHQPKITKVASAQEIVKKRISIESYKQKCNEPTKPLLFRDTSTKSFKEDQTKKQSIKLTEKECERFNLPIKLPLNDSSEDDEYLDERYSHLVPKSPDHEDFADMGIKPPVIIPSDPVKPNVLDYCHDVDMRNVDDFSNNPKEKPEEKDTKDITASQQSFMTPSRIISGPNVTPSGPTAPKVAISTQITSSNSPILVPKASNIIYEGTPSRLDSEDVSSHKHVYAPTFWVGKTDERNDDNRIKNTRESYIREITPKDIDFDSRDSYGRSPRPRTPIHSFTRLERSATPQPLFERLECPTTPLPSFGRMDCPTTPLPSFGRNERAMTPANSFNCFDGSGTNIHSYGRNDEPVRPPYPFNRSERLRPGLLHPPYPLGRPPNLYDGQDGSETPTRAFIDQDGSNTPAYLFGGQDSFNYSEGSTTPSHSFGRTDYVRNYQPTEHMYGRNDPRLNRCSDFDYYNKHEANREYGYYQEPFNLDYSSDRRGSDDFRRYKHHFGRNEMSRSFEGENERYFKDFVSAKDQHDRRNFNCKEPFNRHNKKEYKYYKERNILRKQSEDKYKATYPYENDSNFGRSEASSRKNCAKTSLQHLEEAETTLNTFDNRQQRAASVGRVNSFDNRRQRAASVGRVNSFDSRRHRAASVGRVNHLDSRRQRASSVGRVLTRKCTIDLTTQNIKRAINKSDGVNDRKDLYKVTSLDKGVHERGANTQRSESLKNIRDDLLAFKLKIDINIEKRFGDKANLNRKTYPNKSDTRTDIIKNNKTTQSNELYTPTKNFRDPRFRRESKIEHKDKYKNKPQHKKSGIVYSDANISRGTILGPGCGVKNYKIPKIKRPLEISSEKVTNNGKDTIPEKIGDGTLKAMQNADDKSETIDSKKKDSNQPNIGNCSSDSIDEKNIKTFEENAESNKVDTVLQGNSDRRITRSSVKGDSSIATFIKDTSFKTKRRNTIPINYNKSVSDNDEKLDKTIPIDYSQLENSPLPNKEINWLNNAEKENMTQNKESSVLERDNITNKNSFATENWNTTEDNEATKIIPHNEVSKSSPEYVPGSELNASNISDSICNLQQHLEETKSNNDEYIKNTGEKRLPQESLKNPSRDEDLHSNFGELEIFPDTIASDPVLDNINALIADLDHDIATVKNNETRVPFKQEFLLDHMFDSINEVTNMDKGIVSVEDTDSEYKKKSRVDQNDEPTLSKNVDVTSINKVNDESGILKLSSLPKKSLISPNREIKPSETIPKLLDVDNNSSDAIVSTTKDDMKLPFHEQNTLGDSNNCGSINKPDSTINVVGQPIISNEIVPDSTNESNECNDVISSSNSEIHSASLPVDSSQSADKTDTLGNFLSILQDKSKIKEILSILGGQPTANEKIKKKLEKFSALVSDDEDDINHDCNVKKNYLHEKNEVRLAKNDKDEIEPSKRVNEFGQANAPNDTENLNLEDKNESFDKLNTDAETIKAADATEAENTNEEDSSVDIDKNALSNAEIAPDCAKETKAPKKGRGKKLKKSDGIAVKKRLTRSGVVAKPKLVKPSRELLNLQADVREMFQKDADILGCTTGLRMCRLAKLVDEKSDSHSREESPKNDSMTSVPLEKIKNGEGSIITEKKSKRNSKKKNQADKQNKNENLQSSINKETVSLSDPYLFETDSVNESTEKKEDLAENDSDSAESSRSESSDQILSGLKKKTKRKRNGWQTGIVPKNKKKKSTITKTKIIALDLKKTVDVELTNKISRQNCYIDKTYYFSKNISEYECKLCDKKFKNIVYHYRNEHPHSEIPLSRMSPDVALEAIQQCETIDFGAICQKPSYRYVCRFCFKEFTKCKTLESFFWHIVSAHTGEYKEPCTVCEDDEECPLTLDIPPPPLKQKGQLIGYICGNCNYTQISLENLKTHVITRHNDEQTGVYTINLSHMSAKALKSLVKRTNKVSSSNELEKQRVLRSKRNCVSSEITDEKSVIYNEESDSGMTKRNTKIKSNITFENDSDNETLLHAPTEKNISVKEEPKDIDEVRESGNESEQSSGLNIITPFYEPITGESETECGKGINQSPHFKVTYNDSGSKQYVCCINNHPHYKTGLMISFKKHIQVAHTENWDGYCCICKVIVMPQGLYTFRNCLDHFIEKHLDNFPVLEILTEKSRKSNIEPINECNRASVISPVQSLTKPFLSVRPLSDLLPTTASSESSPLPVIESVVSLGNSTKPTVSYQTQEPVQDEPKRYLYEDAQADIMSKKNRIILDTMISHDKLVQVFKCAGRFCSYTTNSAEDALLHASTHSRIGGDNALKCAYCDFDCLDNAIDLVTHVFKYHGYCQYVCGYCFYRATACQLVHAHITRVHKNAVLKTVLKSLFTTDPIESIMLSREDAVPTYFCTCDDEDGSKCKFKTYTPGKLCEHIKGKHKDVNVHKCFICKETTASVSELVHHYKSHGLKLYQCAWCIFGADTEHELLAHSSIYHAVCQPKAYLRVITNKEGTREFRVLPLAHFNKSKTPDITDVTETGVRENAVREAERSIDLEKLIGRTTLFIETATVEKDTSIEILPDEPSIAESMLNFNPEERVCNPPAEATIDLISAPIIKSEVVPPSSPILGTSTEVICLDSDEEDIVLSDASKEISLSKTLSIQKPTTLVQPSNKQQKLTKQPLGKLYECAKCSKKLKNVAQFKSHLTECFPNSAYGIPCALCSYKSSKTKLVTHYTKNHFTPKSMDQTESAELNARGPVDPKQQSTDNAQDIILSAKKVGGVAVRELTSKKHSKRKTSVENIGEPQAKVKKYGPLDIGQLPINPIFEHFIYCSLCEFNTKVRLNMVRHLQLHANQQPVPQTAPVNPVPHLETNEMHFDRMLNLASSSLANRQDKNNKHETPATSIPLERASWYPKYIPERIRHTCGAKDCSYISLDENMLKCHWETLHSGSNDFHCVHCPPYQTLDTKTPLTASRIIVHLKMHDVNLYACSQCTFYHFKRTVVDKHVTEVHRRGTVMVVREEVSGVSQIPSASASTAPTMDLKPWQCGLCEYKHLLRPEVVEHCAKFHNSKMQFKCVYCAFRTSNEENVIKHQSQSHQELPAVTFYFFYREGLMPNDADGTPFWKIQKQNYGSNDTKIKSEKNETGSLIPTSVSPITPTIVDLSLVKQEVEESVKESIEDLCKLFGQFCEPNGLRYKCPLCKIVIEDTKEAMQSHLFEELQYRRWSCSVCFYKAFHKRGLSEHMTSEHCVTRDPVELPVDVRIETWVTGLLQHQEAEIDNCRNKLAKQKAEIHSKPKSACELKSILISKYSTANKETNKLSREELENKFGALGVSKGMSFCCPKCNEVIQEECIMRNHLETELNKIRWCCSSCPETFTSYHQAQFHCKTHSGQSSRPVEAPRDSAVRTAWVNAVIEVQKLNMDCGAPQAVEQRHLDSPEPSENSLLVVRYEERVPTPEVQSAHLRKSPSSDDERLVINEIRNRKRKATTKCKHCDFSSTNKKVLNDHLLQIHYDLKPFTCDYCKTTGTIGYLKRHQKIYHAMKPMNVKPTQVPNETPAEWAKKKLDPPSAGFICLTCQSPVSQYEVPDHVHENIEREFGRIGEVIVKCSTCNTLHKDINKYEEHKQKQHSNDGNYVFYKLTARPTQFKCSYCPQKFTLKKDLKAHIEATHAEEMKYATLEPQSSKSGAEKVIVLDDEEETMAEVSFSSGRKVARKSTSKLPFHKRVARKSTSKLPMDEQEYSFYGTKPSLEGLDNVTTMIPFYNSYMPITFERLNVVLNINPKVVITKLPK